MGYIETITKRGGTILLFWGVVIFLILCAVIIIYSFKEGTLNGIITIIIVAIILLVVNYLLKSFFGVSVIEVIKDE